LKTLNVIYIIRIALGALAGLIAALVIDVNSSNPLINGITIALAVYLLTYYLLKMQFANKVEKPSKILTMGIGIYFIVFAFSWVLITTPMLSPPVPQFTTDLTGDELVVGATITFDASTSFDPDGDIVSYSWHFGEEDSSTITEDDPIITHTYNTAGEYTVRLTVLDNLGISMQNTTTLTIKNQG
jgi:PKD repeat protein